MFDNIKQKMCHVEKEIKCQIDKNKLKHSGYLKQDTENHDSSNWDVIYVTEKVPKLVMGC